MFYHVYVLMHYMRLAAVYWDDEVVVWRDWKAGTWESFALKDVVRIGFSRDGRSCSIIVNSHGVVKFQLLNDMNLLSAVAQKRNHEEYERKMGRFTKIYNKISDFFK